jgi:hypothetical protein
VVKRQESEFDSTPATLTMGQPRTTSEPNFWDNMLVWAEEQRKQMQLLQLMLERNELSNQQNPMRTSSTYRQASVHRGSHCRGTRARKPGHCPRQRDQLYYYISQSEALNNEPTHASIPAVANQLADIKVESQEAADELAVFSVHKRAGRSHQRTGQSHLEV